MSPAARRARVRGPGRGGWFVAEDEAGRALRVRDAIPGELLLVDEVAGDPGWARVRRVLEPSPDRREPPCPLAGRCGGCHWQHLTDDAQRDLKLEAVRQALRRAGAQDAADAARLVAAPEPLGHRHRARFQAARAADGACALALGFHSAGGRDVVDAPRCAVLAPELAAAWECARTGLARVALSPLTGLSLTALPGGGGALLLLNPRDRAPEPWPAGGEALLAATGPALAGVAVQLPAHDPRPGSVGATAILGWTPGGQPVAAGAHGFLQAGLAGAERLAEEVARLAGARPGARVLELFAGSGLLSWRLAAAGATVVAVEASEPALHAAGLLPAPPRGSLGWRRDDAASAFPALADEPWDALVLDPPRRGLGPLADAVATRGPARLTCCWCDVAAIERDVPTLVAGGYRVTDVVALDLFPQTRHVETVARLERRDAPRGP